MNKKLKNIGPLVALLGVIFSIVVLIIETNQNNKIAKDEFVYGLLIKSMDIESGMERNNYLQFLLKMKWIKESDLYLNIDSIGYYLGYEEGKKKGKLNGLATRSINSSINHFYKMYHRLPTNLNELKNVMRVSRAIDHFNGDVFYQVLSKNDLRIVYPGADGFIHTNDDIIYKFDDIIN